MPRPVPRMVAAWTFPGSKDVFTNRRRTYYAIAKALVVAKYPPWLSEVKAGEAKWYSEAEGYGNWSVATICRRSDRVYELFHEVDDEGDYSNRFDTKRWMAFVRRVARFLEFVDDRRSIEAQLAHIPSDDLEAREQYCEAKATEFAKASIHYHNELARRTAR